MIQLQQTYTYEEIYKACEKLTNQYSEFIRLTVIGTSHDGRKIPMLMLGKGREALICTAGVHGRESVNPTVMLKMAEEYAQAYRNERFIDHFDVKVLLRKYSIYLIPVLNPDGYVIATEGFSMIADEAMRSRSEKMNILSRCWKYNGRGVDINRNFSAKSYIQQTLMEYPNSEPETQALIKVFQGYDHMAYLDFHSRGKIIYYYRAAMPREYNKKQRRIAKELKKAIHYELGKKEEEFLSKASGGNTVHYYSENFGKPAITIETVADEADFPLSNELLRETFSEIYAVPLRMLGMREKDIV